jgi:hypothetical protein
MGAAMIWPQKFGAPGEAFFHTNTAVTHLR